MMFLRQVLGSLLILSATALPSLGQQRPAAKLSYTISGTVQDDAAQHPMENVRVDLKMSTGIPVNTSFTRGNGEFEFNNLANGEYFVEVVLKDYQSAQQRVSVTGSDRRGIYIFLTRATTVVNSNSSASISAHELSVPSKAHDEYEKALNLMYAKSDYRGAILLFQRAIKDFPTFYEAYAQEGNAYMKLGELAPAEEALRKSVDLSSGQYSKALFILAGLLTDRKQYSESAAFARKGMAVDDNSWQGPFELARAQLGLDQTEEAEKNADEARDMNPEDPEVYLLLANILIHRRDYPALLKDLDAYLKRVPAGPDAEQARQTRDDIQAAMQKSENQARENDARSAHAETQDSKRATTPPPAHETESAPPPEPDSSGLPSLPPPATSSP
jgi:tetratricopeptide (TPR) repeat protein